MQNAAEACRKGDLDAIATLDQQGNLQSLILSTDEDGRTLLHSAAASGNLRLLDFLVQKGAGQSVNTADDEVSSQHEAGRACTPCCCSAAPPAGCMKDKGADIPLSCCSISCAEG